MRRIVNSADMKYCDSNTIHYFGVPSLVLMERAALSVVECMPEALSRGSDILVVCGSGNNGADGLAIARLLYQRGCTVTISQMPDRGNRSEENRIQRDIADKYGIPVLEQIPEDDYACIIDALFGVGLSRAPKGEYAQWIDEMNRLCGYKVAVDMPSGVSGDTGDAYEASFQADLTVTFAYQKTGQLLYPGREKCGTVITADIGITDESWLDRRPSCYALEADDLKKIPVRPARSNKGTFGRLLVIAGSKNIAGAALFCAKAAYCTGCGLVKIFTPEDNRTILQTALPEAVLSVYDETCAEHKLQEQLSEAVDWADVIAIGPGIGTGRQARCITEQILEHADVPVVADADALNITAGHLELLQHAKAPIVITPHLGEMARLCGKSISAIQSTMQQTAAEFAEQYHLVCVLKDAVTVTASHTAVYFNTSGCPAMAKGGSGDVLTGMIAALIAQGMAPEEAAAVGVYLHGLAGEAAAAEKGSYSVLAGDILSAIGNVMEEAGKHEGKYDRKISK